MKTVAFCELIIICVIIYYFYTHPKVETVTISPPAEVHWITNSIVCVEPIGVEVKVPVAVAPPSPLPAPPAPFVPGSINDPLK